MSALSPGSRYAILFDAIDIGPVTAPNRFYQVPHCNGMGHSYPRSLAKMRGIKAEGGWGVVCTEEVEIHCSSDITPYNEGRLWDDSDILALKWMTEAVHAHGSLAGIELVHQGVAATNHYSRLPALGPSHAAVSGGYPMQARAMNRQDIRRLRQWYKEAAMRAKKADFDIVYAYAGHGLSILMQFLSRTWNDRSDEYGGSLENRARLLKEVLIDTKEAVGDRCAVALRIAVDELLGESGITCAHEGSDIIELLAEIPDLWDVNVSGWENDSQTSRFAQQGFQEPYTAHVKALTSKPVVGVGRFTSPDTMVSQIKRGVLDLIGAARPSIADPFLPDKIKRGQIDAIRECIGCNICVSSDNYSAPIRCTQNPTMGEEWRRGWHPEKVNQRHAEQSVLIIGAGPAGLECALTLARRGYEVSIAERKREPGGRVMLESQLPGLSAWMRVIDYRINQLQQLPAVNFYFENKVDPANLADQGFENVMVACGARWRKDGLGRNTRIALEHDHSMLILGPDDLMQGVKPQGKVLIYDTDYYYMAGVLAEKCVNEGFDVSYMTPSSRVSEWTVNTLEQQRIQGSLVKMGVKLCLNKTLSAVREGQLVSHDLYSGAEDVSQYDSLVLVTERTPNDGIFTANQDDDSFAHLALIGDAYAPGIIAHAVHSGHLEARLFGNQNPRANDFRREW